MRVYLAVWAVLCGAVFTCGLGAQAQSSGVDESVLVGDAEDPLVAFALGDLKQALFKHGAAAKGRKIRFGVTSGLPPQGYWIQVSEDQIHVSGGDTAGLMYGLLDLAESVELDRVESKTQEPAVRRRGLKFNIPLDARAPSYDDTGDSATNNIAEVWSTDFWFPFLDAMARHRYNALTLWCNHPFSTMLKLEDYPDVAMEDVAIPAYEFDDRELIQYREAKLREPGAFTVVKKMTIQEKIRHWQIVMRYAKERGIDIYFITWNIWVHGAEGKYGITSSQTNDKTIAYMRESMKQFVLTYPDLKGFGVTAGEHMKNKLEGEYSVENWLWNTYGQGIVDAKAEDPDRSRQFEFIHRIWYSGMDSMMDDFINKYPGPMTLGFKYAKARLYSAPDPGWFNKELKHDAERLGLSTWMNLRNDDIFIFRWGNPDYVREYIKHLPPEPLMAGFHMGSDGYVWGREFASKSPQSPRQLEIDKHWYKFMSWGRLGYDPALDRGFFEAKLGQRFPRVNTQALYDTWQTASKIVPLINRYHWRHWDHMWSPETCQSKKEGYHSVDHFIEFGPMPDKNRGLVSIRDYVKNPEASKGLGKSPFQVADELDALASRTLSGVEAIGSGDPELNETLGDMKAFAYLANYYADKIRGSTHVHAYRVGGEQAAKDKAVAALIDAQADWKRYADQAGSMYEVQLLARTSWTDWHDRLLTFAEQDIQIAKDAEQGVFPPSVIHKLMK